MLQESVGDNLEEAGERGLDGAQELLGKQLIEISGVGISTSDILAAVIALLLTWVVSVLVRRAIKRYGAARSSTNQASLYTVSQIAHYVLLAVGLMFALSLLGIPVSKFAVLAGALGVGLGFGLKEIFSNFISGLILLFDKSLRVGDFVELESGVHGEVRDIKIRATTIVTNDNIDILVPNAEFVSGRVVNWTHRDVSRRVRIPFGVAYGTDKERVKKAGLEAAGEVDFTLALDGARKPQVWLVEFGESSVNYELVVWLTAEATKRPGSVKAAYNWALDTVLKKYDIEIPFPQQDLHIRSLFGRQGDEALALLRGQGFPGSERDAHAADVRTNDKPDGDGLPDHERESLSDNDAQQDVQQEIAEAAKREASPRNEERAAPARDE